MISPGTSLHPNWDIDLVFFISIIPGAADPSPPFPEVLSAFEDALLLHFDEAAVQVTGPFSLQAKIHGFALDLLAAPDLITRAQPGTASMLKFGEVAVVAGGTGGS